MSNHDNDVTEGAHSGVVVRRKWVGKGLGVGTVFVAGVRRFEGNHR